MFSSQQTYRICVPSLARRVLAKTHSRVSAGSELRTTANRELGLHAYCNSLSAIRRQDPMLGTAICMWIFKTAASSVQHGIYAFGETHMPRARLRTVFRTLMMMTTTTMMMMMMMMMMMIAFIRRYSPLSGRLTALACDSA